MRYYFAYLTETERVNTFLPQQKFNELYLDAVKKEIKNSYIHNLTHRDNIVKFDAPIFRFVWNGFNMLNAVSKGEVSIKNIGQGAYISYKLFFWEAFIIAIIFSTLPFIAFFPDNFLRILFFVVVWIIYIIATTVATNRFENYLKNLANKINFTTEKK